MAKPIFGELVRGQKLHRTSKTFVLGADYKLLS